MSSCASAAVHAAAYNGPEGLCVKTWERKVQPTNCGGSDERGRAANLPDSLAGRPVSAAAASLLDVTDV